MGATVEPGGKGLKQIRRDQRVRTDNDQRVGEALAQNAGKGISESISLAPLRSIFAGQNPRACFLRQPGRLIGAVVGYDRHSEQLARIVNGA